MHKVFESFDLSHVGQLQSMLEAHGIPTFLKNQYASSVMGEVPFVEICPQLFVLRQRDLERAQELLALETLPPDQGEDWVCAQCSSEVEGQFAQCWNCQAHRPPL